MCVCVSVYIFCATLINHDSFLSIAVCFYCSCCYCCCALSVPLLLFLRHSFPFSSFPCPTSHAVVQFSHHIPNLTTSSFFFLAALIHCWYLLVFFCLAADELNNLIFAFLNVIWKCWEKWLKLDIHFYHSFFSYCYYLVRRPCISLSSFVRGWVSFVF